MKIKNKKLFTIFYFLSKLNSVAYKDIYLLSNPVLSKNPFQSEFINKSLLGEKATKIDYFKLTVKLVLYYLKSFFYFMLYLIQFVLFKFAKYKNDIVSDRKQIVIIDTYFIIDEILNSGFHTEIYFPQLERVLKDRRKQFAYLPVFYGTKNPFKLYKVLKIIKSQQVPAITEYQLYSLSDILSLLIFIIVYPFHVMSFLLRIEKISSNKIKLIRNEIIETLDHVVFNGYSRYLQGRAISKLPFHKIKCISWYENQIIDKNLYKGLRRKDDKVTIYGAQLFLWPEAILNIHPDESEKAFGIVPDKIIVNGQYYIPLKTKLNYLVGPSLRYRHIFEEQPRKPKKYAILVLLPYLENEINNIINILKTTDDKLMLDNLFIKFHPATNKKQFAKLLPSSAKVVDWELKKIFESTKIVIGNSSGALVEAVSKSIPVIVIKNQNTLNFNYLAEMGKGIIWDYVHDRKELKQLLKFFRNNVISNEKEIREIAEWYKKNLFSEPTTNNIIKAFDL